MKNRKIFIWLLMTALVLASCNVVQADDVWICPACGRENSKNFCPADGSPRPAERPSVSVGDKISFGCYPQTKKGKDQTPIEWVVLDVQSNKALLMSVYGLDTQTYHQTNENITWSKCSMRKWLNESFVNVAFTKDEQGKIVITNLNDETKDNIQDQLFLLSVEEVKQYLPTDEERICVLTEYVKTKSPAIQDDTKGWWWLRSLYNTQTQAQGVDYSGQLDFDNVNTTGGAVRPALWVDLSVFGV